VPVSGDIDMVTAEIADLTRRAREDASPTAGVQLLAQAVGLAVDPLQRIELMMLLADAAGRAAYEAAGLALKGQGRSGAAPATWAEIADAAGLDRSTAWRQYHGGEALSWSPAARGVRQAARLDMGRSR
jgi:hypothetical protein